MLRETSWPGAALSPGSRQNASLGKRGALSRVPSVHVAVTIWRGIVAKLSFPNPEANVSVVLRCVLFFFLCGLSIFCVEVGSVVQSILLHPK